MATPDTSEPTRASRLRAGGPPGRPWGLIVVGLLLAGLAAWAGVQSIRSAAQEQRLRAELKQVYLDAESLRSVATQWQERSLLFEQQAAALTAERDALARRIKELEAELAALKGRRFTGPSPRR